MRFPRSTYREVEGVRGYRWWRVGPGGWLLSPWREAKPWPRQPERARCLTTRRLFGWRQADDHPDGPPDPGCHCGFYGLHRYPAQSTGPTQFVWNLDTGSSGSGAMLLGIAEASGRVVVGTHGWRAEYARPRALYVAPWAFPSADVDGVGDRYELPVYRNFEALQAEWGPDHGLVDDLAG
jgi:hypothetical protein